MEGFGATVHRLGGRWADGDGKSERSSVLLVLVGFLLLLLLLLLLLPVRLRLLVVVELIIAPGMLFEGPWWFGCRSRMRVGGVGRRQQNMKGEQKGVDRSYFRSTRLHIIFVLRFFYQMEKVVSGKNLRVTLGKRRP